LNPFAFRGATVGQFYVGFILGAVVCFRTEFNPGLIARWYHIGADVPSWFNEETTRALLAKSRSWNAVYTGGNEAAFVLDALLFIASIAISLMIFSSLGILTSNLCKMSLSFLHP
jgi:hypothetical protein